MIPPDIRAGLPSASILGRLSNCPASWHLGWLAIKQGIANHSSAASDSGHKIHKWLETSDEIDWAALTEDEQITARACAKHATTIIDEWNEGGNYQRRHEHRLWLYDDGAVVPLRALGKPIFSGAADVIVINEDHSRAAVLDFKTGRSEYQPAAGNLQLAALAVLVAGWTGARSVRVALIQPLAGPPSVADYDGEELDKTRADLLRLLDHIEEPGLVPHPGDWCKFCAAKPICPALTHELAMLSDPSLTPEETKEAIAESAGDLDAKRLGDYLHTAKRVQWMIDALKDEAKRRIEACDPSAPIGWTLRPGAKTREITELAAAFDRLNEHFGVSPNEMLDACKVSLPNLETSVAKRSGIPKTRVVTRIADALGNLITYGHKAPILVEEKPALEVAE